jgi:hypothetical protein
MTEPTQQIEVQRAILGKHNHQGVALVGEQLGVLLEPCLVALWRERGSPEWTMIAFADTLFELFEKVKVYDARKQRAGSSAR